MHTMLRSHPSAAPPAVRRALRLVVATCLALLLLPTAALAQSKPAQGSPLANPANYPYNCQARWLPGPTPPFDYVPDYGFPSPTCALFQPGTSNDDTGLVPGPGKVSSARVRAGANPAPISIVVLRSFEGRNPQSPGTLIRTCCQNVGESAVFTPTPNAVTEVPLDLTVDTKLFDPNSTQVGWHDIVGINVHGPGDLPVADLGNRSVSAPKSVHAMRMSYPKPDPGQNVEFGWFAGGFEVLMNYSWCANTGTRQTCGKTVPPVDGGGGGGTTGGGSGTQTPATKPTATIRSKRLALKGRKTVGVQVACGRSVVCNTTVRLRTKAKKPVVLGSKKAKVGAGKSATVKVPVSAKNRRKVARKGTKVTIEVDLGGGAVVRRGVTLRR